MKFLVRKKNQANTIAGIVPVYISDSVINYCFWDE
jgi:hypothetical protein